MNKLIGTNFRIKENDVLFEAGKRLLENKNKNKTKLKPLITLITVVKNNDKFLEKTIKSVLNQSYKEIEYIIVDGGSKDDSLNIIKKYSDQIDYAVSQNDQGLWDAMNKGLSLATGDLIGIVNSDDTLRPNALETLYKYYSNYPDTDFFFGSVKKHWGILHGYRPWKIKYSWFFYSSHSTGFYIKKEAAEKVGKYSLKYKYSSDFDYFYRMIVHQKLRGISTKKNEIFGDFSPGGISSYADFWEHFYEKNQIRIDNKQNKFFLIVLIFLKIIYNYKKFKSFKFKEFQIFIKQNFF